MIKASDISINLSGGTNNNNPNLSLGGDPSIYDVPTGLQNLFANVTATEAVSGIEDYRCIYVFNNSSDSTLYNTYIYLDSVLDANPQLTLGLFLANDTQTMVISGGILDHGKLQLRYGESGSYSYTAEIEFNKGLGFNKFVEDLQDALNVPSIGLTGVQMSGTQVNSVYNIQITFTNNDGFKYQPTLAVASNTLVTETSTTPTILITKVVSGSPINTIPPVIEANVAPLGVSFYTTGPKQQKLVGTLTAGEGFPIWVRRRIPINANASETSGATLKIKGGSLP